MRGLRGAKLNVAEKGTDLVGAMRDLGRLVSKHPAIDME
jgi:hypothetical protein